MNRSQKQRRANLIVIIAEMVVTLALVIVLIGNLVRRNYLRSEFLYPVLEVEAGTDVTISAKDFLVDINDDASFAEESESFDINKPGEYRIIIESNGRLGRSVLHVIDTTPPDAEVKILQISMGDTCSADAFLFNINEIDEYTVEYISQVDFKKYGYQDVDILITDATGNSLTVHTGLFITDILPEYTIEAGSSLPDPYVYAVAAKNVKYAVDPKSVDTTKVGETVISIYADGNIYDVLLKVADTQPPQFDIVDVDGYCNAFVVASDFVANVSDASSVNFSFEAEPDMQLVGTQFVTIVGTDSFGNTVSKPAFLKLEADLEPPVITGVHDMEAYVGEGVVYKDGISVTDNSGADIALEVDSTRTDIYEEGSFFITYTATDPSGNSTSVTAELIVGVKTANEEETREMVRYYLKQIITDEMDDIQKLRAIFDFIVDNVCYTRGTPKGDPVGVVYTALTKGTGDCFAFACTSEMFLTEAGFQNVRINKIPSTTRHYWNLVDIGDGWYHFDTCEREDYPEIFLWNDDMLMLYSNTHDLSHNYDRSKVPVCNASGNLYEYCYGADFETPRPNLGSVLETMIEEGELDLSEYWRP